MQIDQPQGSKREAAGKDRQNQPPTQLSIIRHPEEDSNLSHNSMGHHYSSQDTSAIPHSSLASISAPEFYSPYTPEENILNSQNSQSERVKNNSAQKNKNIRNNDGTLRKFMKKATSFLTRKSRKGRREKRKSEKQGNETREHEADDSDEVIVFAYRA
jgi:hypothetical protein